MWLNWILVFLTFGVFKNVVAYGETCLYVSFTDQQFEDILTGCSSDEVQHLNFVLTTVDEVLPEQDTSAVLMAAGPGLFCTELTPNITMNDNSFVQLEFFLRTNPTSLAKVCLQLTDFQSFNREVCFDNQSSKESINQWNDVDYLPLGLEANYPNVKVKGIKNI